MNAMVKPVHERLPLLTTIFAVTVEDCNSGRVDWFWTKEAAEASFSWWRRDMPEQEINLFPFDVPTLASIDQITNLADARMWARDYVPILTHNRDRSLEAA